MEEYYQGGFFDVDNEPMSIDKSEDAQAVVSDPPKNQLLEEKIEPREKLSPLFVNLSDRLLSVPFSGTYVFHSAFRKPQMNWIILGHPSV